MLNALKQSISREPDIMRRIIKEDATSMVELFITESTRRWPLDEPGKHDDLEAYAVGLLLDFFAASRDHDTVACALASMGLIRTKLDLKAFELSRK